MARRHAIFALVGPSGSGKSALLGRMLARFPDTLGVVRSVTTRARREDESEELYLRDYEHVTPEEFAARNAAGRLIQHGATSYPGGAYDNDRDEVDAMLATRFGICAWVEPAVVLFRQLGYRVVMIRIVPEGPGYANRSAERVEADRKREAAGPHANKFILNEFAPGGLERAQAMLGDFLASEMERLSLHPLG